MANSKPPPDLNIPSSSSTVKVHVIDTTSHISKIPTSLFLEPQYEGIEFLDCPAFSFLIEHPPSGRKFLFDLGVRKDWENYSHRIANRIKDQGWDLKIEKGVAETLDEGGVRPKDIEGIVWRFVFLMNHTILMADHISAAITTGTIPAILQPSRRQLL